MKNSELIQALEWRYAVKKFDANKTINQATLDALISSLQLSPSSFGLQPWKFIVISNQEILDKLKGHSWNQPQIADCSHLVVFASQAKFEAQAIEDFITTLSQERSKSLEQLQFYKDMIFGFLEHKSESEFLSWSQHQVYLALGLLLTSTAALGVDSCPLEGIDPKAYDDILNLKESGFQTTVACAIGYRDEQDPYLQEPKVRYSQDKLVTYYN